MKRLGSLHGIDRDALIESGEVSIALHRERQKVDIEESGQSGPQGSSSNRSTSSELTGRESSQGGSNGIQSRSHYRG